MVVCTWRYRNSTLYEMSAFMTWHPPAKKKTKKHMQHRDSLVATDPATNPAVGRLSKGERTGSRVFYHLWSYVLTGSKQLGLSGGNRAKLW